MQRGGIWHGMRVCLLTASASLALLVASAPTAWGQSAPTVVYDGASEQIVFEGADGTDLLLGAKDLMPGDAIEQSVRVEARNLRRPVELFVETVFEGPVRCPVLRTSRSPSCLMDAKSHADRLLPSMAWPSPSRWARWMRMARASSLFA